DVARDSLHGSIENQEPVRIGRRDSGLGFYGQLDEFRILRFAVSAAAAREWFWSERIAGILPIAENKRDARQKRFLLDCFVEHHGDPVTQTASAFAEETRKTETAYRAKL